MKFIKRNMKYVYIKYLTREIVIVISAVTTTTFVFLHTPRLMAARHQDLTGGVMIAAAGRTGRAGGAGG